MHQISPEMIAQALGKSFAPTPEQRAVITAPLEPALVVAGAGSGKTETMSQRVLWLVANGLVAPEQILGLTFTKKAAGELQSRIALQLRQLRSWQRANGISFVQAQNQAQNGANSAGAGGGAHATNTSSASGSPSLPELDFAVPTISTYNAFADRIFRDNALIVGRDPNAELIGDSAAWLLAREVARASTNERLADLDKNESGVAELILRLTAALGDNVVDVQRLAGFGEQLLAVLDLPETEPGERALSATKRALVERLFSSQKNLSDLSELAVAFDEEKRKRGLTQFSDQVRFALAAAEADSRVGETLRTQYRVVLLDEYQDTSVVQIRLLTTLFAGAPVMAVGDPNQSIYGWRGASAETLQRFARDFSATLRFSLTTSWRNSSQILEVANHTVKALPAGGVDTLQPSPSAGAGRVTIRHEETLDQEIETVADWVLDQRQQSGEISAAILLRTKKHMRRFADALEARGIPVQVAGVDALFDEPEIADITSALRVVSDPDANNALLRLLAGARWRIGPKDLWELGSYARLLQRRGLDGKQLSDELQAKLRASTASDAHESLVDALDELSRNTGGAAVLERFSEQGLLRMQEAGRLFADLRRHAGLPLIEFIRLVERRLHLDIELAANPGRRRGRANLDAFLSEVQSFTASDSLGTLGSLVSWLDRAENSKSEMQTPSVTPAPGVVQILTVHGAKGLEWDAVAVPCLVNGSFPTSLKFINGWLRLGELPYEFRGDRDALPQLQWRSLATQHEAHDAITQLQEQNKANALEEERRLAYVAFTRARHSLLLSASTWSVNVKPHAPSIFLEESAALLGQELRPEPEKGAENPVSLETQVEVWPRDPLGKRRARIEAAAQMIAEQPDNAPHRWSELVDRLLDERARNERNEQHRNVPERIAASGFKDWVADPLARASVAARPLPQRPFRATRLGTLFHEWVETRATSSFGLSDHDPDLFSTDVDDEELVAVDGARLATLRATFERSKYATLTPLETEIEIHALLGEQVVVCKLDAVFAEGDGILVVDWKTGKLPQSDHDLAERAAQLALYRVAYSQYSGRALEDISAEFYFVEYDTIIRPDALMTESELTALWATTTRRILGERP
ncbi:UvrD-helicase domain-containing protein [Humidisolicoccus flavus]|uniref:UvrD-helicase domain-containing protein n=1 Tax=Humidisolicoccus flavus TaxID=3111414 RepID=UPI00324C5A6C